MSWGNFSLIVNSKFQPFSFERYIQPYQMYGEAYKEVENTLGELATKANGGYLTIKKKSRRK